MKLLVDTDAFCKLQVAGLLDAAADLLVGGLGHCGRLQALPHMLRRGKLREHYGAAVCDALIPVATAMAVVPEPSDLWLDKLTPVPEIDAGEALIFAAASEKGFLVVTDDKRALRALKDLEGFAPALAGRLVVLEALLIALCDRLGVEEVRRRILPLAATDMTVQVCFSSGNPEPKEALLSYLRSQMTDLAPLVLWKSEIGERP